MRSSAIFVFVTIIGFGQAKVELTEGKSTTVKFEGDELSIDINNPNGQKGAVELCFRATSDNVYNFCPAGYAGVSIPMSQDQTQENFKLNRRGQVFSSEYKPKVGGNVIFESDGTINVLLAGMPSGVSIHLPNAEIPVSTTTVSASEKKGSSDNTAMIGIVCGIAVFVLVLVVIGCLLAYFCWYRKRSHQPVPMTVPDEEGHRTRNEAPEAEEPLLPMVLIETPAPGPSKCPLKPSATTTTTTRKTSTSTTPASDEQPQVGVVPKPAPTTPVVMPSDLLSLASASTQKEESTCVTPKRKSRKSKSKASKKSRRRRSKTPKKTPIEKQAGSPSLPVDRTQSPTMPSTQATPDYPNDPLTNAQADSSQYNKRDYLKRSEAPVPGSARSRSRSRPIVDEVDDYKLQTGSILCFTQRNGRLDDHHHWMITDRINLTRPHTISVAERTLLKAAPKDAPELADIVLDEAEKGMAPFLEGRPIGWTESHLLWTHFNALDTPISASYIAIYRLMPSLFTLETPSLADPLVRKMPITGLYTLLLDRQFPRTFRVNLAAEIRDRASRILPRVQMYQMKNVAFPTNYLMLIYNKNKESFVQGKEIHSLWKK